MARSIESALGCAEQSMAAVNWTEPVELDCRRSRSVVRTMKSLPASNIVQYEQSVRALADYTSSVELGLSHLGTAGDVG